MVNISSHLFMNLCHLSSATKTYQCQNICKMYLSAHARWWCAREGDHPTCWLVIAALQRCYWQLKLIVMTQTFYVPVMSINICLQGASLVFYKAIESQVEEVITWMFWSPHHKLGVSKCMVLKTIYYTVKLHNYVNLVRMTCEGLPVQ